MFAVAGSREITVMAAGVEAIGENLLTPIWSEVFSISNNHNNYFQQDIYIITKQSTKNKTNSLKETLTSHSLFSRTAAECMDNSLLTIQNDVVGHF